MNNNNFTIISFYQFIKLRNLIQLKKFFTEFCSFHKLRGTILLAPEGINGAIAGLGEPIQQFKKGMYFKEFNNLELSWEATDNFAINYKLQISDIPSFSDSDLL